MGEAWLEKAITAVREINSMARKKEEHWRLVTTVRGVTKKLLKDIKPCDDVLYVETPKD